MTDCLREWERYEVIRALGENQGITILNATAGSFLDVFTSAKLGDLVEAPRNSKSDAMPSRSMRDQVLTLIEQ